MVWTPIGTKWTWFSVVCYDRDVLDRGDIIVLSHVEIDGIIGKDFAIILMVPWIANRSHMTNASISLTRCTRVSVFSFSRISRTGHSKWVKKVKKKPFRAFPPRSDKSISYPNLVSLMFDIKNATSLLSHRALYYVRKDIGTLFMFISYDNFLIVLYNSFHDFTLMMLPGISPSSLL